MKTYRVLTLFACFMIASYVHAQTEVIAHRGFHAKDNSTNNSLSALKNAQELGVYGSECDVNETKDGVLVVVHGPKHGKYNVQNTNYATLRAKALDNGETLPTLNEYLELASQNRQTKLIIEIKSHDTPQRETKVVKNVLKAVKKFKLQKDVEYIAFRQHVCDELVKYGPKGIKVAYLNGNLTPAYCKGLGYSGIDYHYSVLKKNPEWIQECKELGLTVNIWTVNDTKTIQWCIDQEVDYITTDNPIETIKLIQQKADKH